MQTPKQSQQLSPRQQQWHDEQKQFEASGLTARWKELFAQNPKRSMLHLIDRMRKKAD